MKATVNTKPRKENDRGEKRKRCFLDDSTQPFDYMVPRVNRSELLEIQDNILFYEPV